MKNNFEITTMNIDDLNSISEILETDFDNFWNYSILKKELEDSNSTYIICKNNSEIIGFAGITLILDTAELNNIVVKKSYRGYGISSLILEKIIDIAKTNNCKHINLEVSSLNTIAINLYKKFKFKQVGLRPNYYKNSDALLFTLDI